MPDDNPDDNADDNAEKRQVIVKITNQIPIYIK
jgi:hypothetical protein